MMSLEDFKRLPESMQPIELFYGELIVSPSPKHTHQHLLGELYIVLNTIKRNGNLAIFSCLFLKDNNVPIPDIFWVRDGSKECQIQEDDYWHGAPDLVVEVLSPSTAKRDKTVKFEIYQKNAVREYWIADPYNETLEAYTLQDKIYKKLGVFSKEDTFDSPVLGKSVDLSLVF